MQAGPEAEGGQQQHEEADAPPPQEPAMVRLSEQERKVLEDFRRARAAAQRADAVDGGDDGGSRDSWASILAEDAAAGAEAFSKFHGHFAGLALLDKRALRRAAVSELKDASRWDAAMKEAKRPALVAALPEMSLAVRSTRASRKDFSAALAHQAYVGILRKFVAAHPEEPRARRRKRSKKGKKSKKGAKKRRRFVSPSESSSESSSEQSGEYVLSSSSSSSGSSSGEDERAHRERLQDKNTLRRVGAESYTQDHLFDCTEYVQLYQRWFDPEDSATQTKTIPMELRKFIKRHFAEPGAPVLSAFDQKHVKGSPKEAKHVTFLLNKIPTPLASSLHH